MACYIRDMVALHEVFDRAVAVHYASAYVEVSRVLGETGQQDVLLKVVHALLKRMKATGLPVGEAAPLLVQEMESMGGKRMVQAAAVVVAMGGLKGGDTPTALPEVHL